MQGAGNCLLSNRGGTQMQSLSKTSFHFRKMVVAKDVPKRPLLQHLCCDASSHITDIKAGTVQVRMRPPALLF